MRHNMLKIIFFLLFTCLGSTTLLSQIKTEEYPQKALKPDSLFTEFEYPKLPIYIEPNDRFYQYKKGIVIACIKIVISFDVKSNGEIRELHINPLYNDGNNIPKKDIFWKDMEKNIRNSAKKWKFKKLYFPDGYQPENPYINKSLNRPYYGAQNHIMILYYDNDVHTRGLASFLYWMYAP